MDTDIRLVRGQLNTSLKMLKLRRQRLEESKQKLSRHFSKLAHTRAMEGLLEELLGLLHQDPDLWDDEPDIVPF